MPLYRNGYALVLSSATTSGLGIVYWIVASRHYSTDAIGLNAAALSAMTFLGGVAQLNLIYALNRFIPSAGEATGKFVRCAYLISSMVALVASLIFILGLDTWAPALNFIDSSPFFVLWFMLATVSWCIFALQDGVLVGLRQATWVPIENTIFALGKLLLLISCATLLPQYGVFASWTIPLVILLPLTNLLIFRHLIPRHVQATENKVELLIPVEIVRYVASDYLGSLLSLASMTLLPIMVTQMAGAAANAHYYLSWTISYSLYLVSRNMGMSLISEAALDQTKLETYSYRVLVQTSRLLVPGVAVIVLGAPYILGLFGDSYVREGTTLLRLLCLSALPNIIITVYTSVARVQRRMLAVILVMGSLCVLVLTLGFMFLELYGITGVGLAWLLSQTIVAGILVLLQFRSRWPSRIGMKVLGQGQSVATRPTLTPGDADLVERVNL